MDQPPRTFLMIGGCAADAELVRTGIEDAFGLQVAIRWATSLADASQLLADQRFDAVLLDLNLPDTAGLKTLTALGPRRLGVPVIVLTDQDDQSVGVEAIRRGAEDYLAKSEIRGLLRRSLRYAIERHSARVELDFRETSLRVIVQQLPAIVWTTDTELRFTSSMGKALSALNLKSGQVVGMSMFDYFQTEDADFEPIALHRQALRGEAVSSNILWAGCWFHVHVEPLRDLTGAIVGTVGVSLDISDQQRLDRLQQSVDAARTIQNHLMPVHAPRLPGFDIAGACFPADQCSGDYFDFIPLRDNCWGIVVADVSGHGFGPAILAATVRSYLRASASMGKDAHEMLTVTNWLLTHDHPTDHFASLFLCRINPRERTFVYASAGHVGYLIDYEGRMRTLRSASIPLGIEKGAEFLLSTPVRFKPGDLLLLSSDGVVEAQNSSGDLFGVERMREVACRNFECPAQEIIEKIYQATRDFSSPAPQFDDVTLVAVRTVARGDDDTW